MLIGALHVRHRARSATKLATGMFSYHDSSREQCGHADEGQTMDAPSGRRWIQTFRKLPTMAPNAPAATRANKGGSVSVMGMWARRRPARPAARAKTTSTT